MLRINLAPAAQDGGAKNKDKAEKEVSPDAGVMDLAPLKARITELEFMCASLTEANKNLTLATDEQIRDLKAENVLLKDWRKNTSEHFTGLSEENDRLIAENEALKAKQNQIDADEEEIRKRMEVGLTREQAKAAIERQRHDKEKHQPARDAARKDRLARVKQ